jgi:N-acetylmuramoyl-L-alanine amidase
VFKSAGILACLLVVAAGCTTTPTNTGKPGAAKELPPDWEMSPPEKPTPIAPPRITAPKAAPPPGPAPPAAPEMKWISLNRWSEKRGLGALRRLSVSPLESYALPTTNGVLILTVGNLTAYWNGLELRLGFAPQKVDGLVFVHALDARKNFEPLLNGFCIPAKTNRVVVLDPGHGGLNSGARSVADGRLEKEFTLDWARRLAPLLEQAGWRVFLTRTSDLDVPLTNRVAFAEKHHADLFISLHFNTMPAPNSEPNGLESYCLTPVGMASTVTRGFRDDISDIFPNNAFDDQNLQYAVRLHRALLAVNGNVDRGIRRARFPGVLQGQHCPAVLLEGGYLSNPAEAKRIADPAYRQKLAEAVAVALR